MSVSSVTIQILLENVNIGYKNLTKELVKARSEVSISLRIIMDNAEAPKAVAWFVQSNSVQSADLRRRSKSEVFLRQVLRLLSHVETK